MNRLLRFLGKYLDSRWRQVWPYRPGTTEDGFAEQGSSSAQEFYRLHHIVSVFDDTQEAPGG